MKLKFLRLGLFSLIATFFITSCESNDELVEEQKIVMNTEEIQNLMITEDVSSEIELILEEEEEDLFGSFFKREIDKEKSSNDKCFTRTVSVDEVNNTRTITLDFGEACESERGKVRSGKIIIVKKREIGGFSKSISFDNFSIDGKEIEGSKSSSIVRENENGNKVRSYTSTITMTLVSGDKVSLSQNKNREMIAGSNTIRKEDNVFSITGTSSFVNKEGLEIFTTITDALIRNFSCKYIVKGVKEITKDGKTFSLDFGNGDCDNLAIVTDANGDSKEIELKR